MQVVTIDTKGRALAHVAHVSRAANEEIMWVAIGNGGPWTITFDKLQASSGSLRTGSPYNFPSYVVPNNGHVMSGPLKGTTEVGETYRYNVRAGNSSAGAITDDPDIDIE